MAITEDDVELQGVHVDIGNHPEIYNTGQRRIHFEDESDLATDPIYKLTNCHADPNSVTEPASESAIKNQQLHLAVFLGNLSFSELLDSADPKFVVQAAEKTNGEVLLHAACRSWSFSADETIKIIKQLVEWDIQFRKKDQDSTLLKKNKDGNIPLHIACSSDNDNYAKVEALLHFQDVNQKAIFKHQIEATTAYFENTAVHIAAWYNNERILKTILKKAPNKELLQKKNVNGDSPVHLAAERGNVRILEVMHSFHKDCFHNNSGRLNWSPLHTACAFGQLEAVKKIVFLSAIHCANDNNGSQQELKNWVLVENPKFLQLTKFDETILTCADVESISPLHLMIAPKIDKLYGRCYGDKQMTPLKLACLFGHANIVKFLLKVGHTITKSHEEMGYKEALIAALENSHEECLKQIVVYSDYKQLIELLQKDKNENEDLKGSRDHDHKVALFNTIIQKMPKVAKCILDKCVEFDQPNLSCFTVKYDLIHPTTEDSEMHNYRPQPILINENHPLKTMIMTNNVKLLKHPVVASFLYNRWNSRYGFANFLYWLVYFMYLLFVTYTLVWVLPAPFSNYCGSPMNGDNETHDNTSNSTGSIYTHSTTVFVSSEVLLNIMAALILVYSSIRLFFIEVYQFLSALHFSVAKNYAEKQHWLKRITNLGYIQDYSNWLEILLFILSIAYAIIIFNANSKSFCLSEVEWQVGVIITCLSWIELILISRQFKFVGVQAQTFCRVFTSLIVFAPFAIFLFAAFGISFYLLLRQSMTDKTTSLYSSPFYSMLSMYAMIGGYVEPDSVFHLDTSTIANPTLHIYYEIFIFLFWALSLLFITVILSNIMIGIAVGDINKIYAEADFERLKLQVHYIVQTVVYEAFLGSRTGILIGKTSRSQSYNRNRTIPLNSIRKRAVFFLWGGTNLYSDDTLQEIQQCQARWPSFEVLIDRKRLSTIDCLINSAKY